VILPQAPDSVAAKVAQQPVASQVSDTLVSAIPPMPIAQHFRQPGSCGMLLWSRQLSTFTSSGVATSNSSGSDAVAQEIPTKTIDPRFLQAVQRKSRPDAAGDAVASSGRLGNSDGPSTATRRQTLAEAAKEILTQNEHVWILPTRQTLAGAAKEILTQNELLDRLGVLVQKAPVAPVALEALRANLGSDLTAAAKDGSLMMALDAPDVVFQAKAPPHTANEPDCTDQLLKEQIKNLTTSLLTANAEVVRHAADAKALHQRNDELSAYIAKTRAELNQVQPLCAYTVTVDV